MFPNLPYIEINREERHFCALFAHALLSSELIRAKFTERMSKDGIQLDALNMEVFLEAAALRDYWNKLGNPSKYDQTTHEGRRGVLISILNYFSYPIGTIDEYSFFWTTDKREKLWNPGHWQESDIKRTGLDKLLHVKWAFNAKPDILIISNGQVLMVEAKLESREGKYGDSNEGQLETQELVAHLLKELVPPFSHFEFHNMLLALRPENKTRWPFFISWQEVINILDVGLLDNFTYKCFNQLREKHYYTINNAYRQNMEPHSTLGKE